MPSGTSVLSRPILTRYFIRRALFEVQCVPEKRKGDGVQRNRTPREKPASLRTNRSHNKRERFLGPVNDSGPENVTPAFAIKSNCLHEVERGRLILNSSETVFPQVPVRVLLVDVREYLGSSAHLFISVYMLLITCLRCFLEGPLSFGKHAVSV